MNTDKSRIDRKGIANVMKAAARRGYDPRNSHAALAAQWSLAFRFRRVK